MNDAKQNIDTAMQEPDAEFTTFIKSLPFNHWSKYDFSAVRLGWEAHKQKPPLTLEMQWDGDVLYVRGVKVVRLAAVERSRGQWCTWSYLPEIDIDDLKPITGKAKARKIAEKGVIDWFERMTGESDVG